MVESGCKGYSFSQGPSTAVLVNIIVMSDVLSPASNIVTHSALTHSHIPAHNDIAHSEDEEIVLSV